LSLTLGGSRVTKWINSLETVRLRNDLYCVERGVKLYSLTPSKRTALSMPNVVEIVALYA